MGHHVEEADPPYGRIGLTFVPRATAGIAEWAADGTGTIYADNGDIDLTVPSDADGTLTLVASGAIRPSSVRTYTVGRLVVVWRTQAQRPASLEALADERYAVVAIANPEIAPYGAAAREALRRSGVWAVSYTHLDAADD